MWDEKGGRTHTTSYWGFRELTDAEMALVAGGDAYSDCIADGDGVSDCIPTVEIVGERGTITTDWDYEVPIPVAFTFVSAPTTANGLPVVTPQQKEEFCTYVAQKAWERAKQMRQSGEIPLIAWVAVTEERVKAEAKRVCLSAF